MNKFTIAQLWIKTNDDNENIFDLCYISHESAVYKANAYI